MNPVVIIPTYWSGRDGDEKPGAVGLYDHTTPIAGPAQLADCLESLKSVRGLGRVIVLVTAPAQDTQAATAVCDEICEGYPEINTLVIDRNRFRPLREAIAVDFVDRLEMSGIDLSGYGAIKNVGLVLAAVLGHDVVVFVDDDEVAVDSEFLVNAVYGLGQKTRQGLPIIAKSGYFLDTKNSALANQRYAKWYNRRWSKREEFNSWMREAMKSPRISRSNILSGGCMSLHAEAFTRVSFDPWITRGEDMDYLINLRLYGIETWFDNKWFVRHMPPREKESAPRFLQNVYRWTYDAAKIEAARVKIDLHEVTPASLMPYPGTWLDTENLKHRISYTALLRGIFTKEHAAYLSIFGSGRREAAVYADEYCGHYLRFQEEWATLMSNCWQNGDLAGLLVVQQ